MDWLNAVAQGVLIGGLYALFAAGLSLIFGVMRLVNIAHGDLILLAAYVTLAIVAATGLNPLVAIVIASPVMALFGYVLQRVVFNRTIPMASAPSASLCSTSSAGRSRSRYLRPRNDLRASGTHSRTRSAPFVTR